MIVSHSHKFIFIKPRKVAGTTIELKLSPFLQAGDYATPIEPQEEPLRVCEKGVYIGKIHNKKLGLPLRLRDHSTLKKAYLVLENKVQNYLIISACRNPWDRAVSQFFWSYRKRNIINEKFSIQKTEFNRFTKIYGPQNWINLIYGRKRQRTLNSCHLYKINKKIAANFVIRYEHLEKDFSALRQFLNLPEEKNSKNYNAKSVSRPNQSREWQNFYFEDTKELVRQCCNEEIQLFNYDFEGKNKLTGPIIQPKKKSKINYGHGNI